MASQCIPLLRGELKHKVLWEPLQISFHCPDKDARLHDILKARAALRLYPYVFAGYFKRVIKKSDVGTLTEKQAPTDGPLTSIKWTWGQAAEEAGLGSMVKGRSGRPRPPG